MNTIQDILLCAMVTNNSETALLWVGFSIPHVTCSFQNRNCGLLVFFSSHVLFSISQKLIQHHMLNYTEILKWLREILVCRNTFLQKHKEYANFGSNIRMCRQAHIKLEVRHSGLILKSVLTLSCPRAFSSY